MAVARRTVTVELDKDHQDPPRHRPADPPPRPRRDHARRPIAVEVELQRKMRKRLLHRHDVRPAHRRRRLTARSRPYICGNRDIEDRVTSLGDYASLFAPQLKIRVLDVVIEQTRVVARDDSATSP